MNLNENTVFTIVSSAPNRTLSSRVRLQKTAYLLQQLGFESRLSFQYYHFGPYSRELDLALFDASAFDLVTESIERRQSDGATYSLFKAQNVSHEKSFGSLGEEETKKLITKFAATTVTILELAATIHWIWKYESIPDWRSETIRRKGVKTEGGRIDRAITLLSDLGLSPEVAPIKN
jgi:uncharacterized protein